MSEKVNEDKITKRHNDFLVWVQSRSKEERREFLVRIGQIDDEGRLTKLVGGEAEPSDKYEPLRVEA